MKYFIRAIRFEFAFILSSKAWWIVSSITLVVQPFFAFISAAQLAEIGIDATPETQPMLAGPLPPLEYLGFDLVPFGQAAIVVLGGIIGASIYRGHELRASFLCMNKRTKSFLAKVAAVLVGSVVVSTSSIILTIILTHVGLGVQGLDPLILSPITWRFIGYSSLNWILLIILSFGIGMASRSAIVPLLFMVPQVVGLGSFLATEWEWGGYLPVAAGNLLFAVPTDAFAHDPIKGGMILALWALVGLAVAAYLFVSRDVGGTH